MDPILSHALAFCGGALSTLIFLGYHFRNMMDR
jgi:hypothetical protein